MSLLARVIQYATTGSDLARRTVLGLAREIVTKLEIPEEAVMRQGYETGAQQMCIRVAIDLGLFRMLANSTSPRTASQLAASTDAEESLIIRIMRVLTSIGYAAEAGPELYTASPKTHVMVKPEYEAMVRSASDDSAQIFARLHIYFQEKGYKSVIDFNNGPVQWNFGTPKNYFEWIQENPQQREDLTISMRVMRNTRQHWFEWYPVQQRLLDGCAGETEKRPAPLMVDVGGADGTDLRLFLKRYPEAHNYDLVLQDLPTVIEKIPRDELPTNFVAMGHDFFNAQPVKGARCYYMHRVMHDWSDPEAADILKQLKAAMRPQYSRILIDDVVLPDTNCPSFDAAGDLNMMVLVGGIKRTQRQWVALIERAGLVLEKIWRSNGDNMESIIEITRND